MKDTIELADEILSSNDNFTAKIERALMLCNRQINISLSKFMSAKASDDTQFVHLVAKSMNHLKKDIYMKYIEAGKKEGVIDSRLSNKTIELYITAINQMGLTISQNELENRQSEIIQLFLYGLLEREE